jgi:hypothetical protein
LFDLSFRKMFSAPGNTKLQFQADLFNALNHTNFSDPSTNLSAAGFGQITAAGPPRNVQLALRFTF